MHALLAMTYVFLFVFGRGWRSLSLSRLPPFFVDPLCPRLATTIAMVLFPLRSPPHRCAAPFTALFPRQPPQLQVHLPRLPPSVQPVDVSAGARAHGPHGHQRLLLLPVPQAVWPTLLPHAPLQQCARAGARDDPRRPRAVGPGPPRLCGGGVPRAPRHGGGHCRRVGARRGEPPGPRQPGGQLGGGEQREPVGAAGAPSRGATAGGRRRVAARRGGGARADRGPATHHPARHPHASVASGPGVYKKPIHSKQRKETKQPTRSCVQGPAASRTARPVTATRKKTKGRRRKKTGASDATAA